MVKLPIFLIIIAFIALVFFGVWIFDNINAHPNQPITSDAQVGASFGKAIVSFAFAGLNPPVDGIITDENHTVVLVVPYGTDLKNLVPTVKVSDGASIQPESGKAQDFSSTLIYTVTGASGSHQDYTVSVKTAKKPVQAIASFSILGQAGNTVINQDAHTITLVVPYGFSLVNVVPSMTLIAGATVSPQSSDPQDFTKPVSYAITTADKVGQVYTVTVNFAPAPQN